MATSLRNPPGLCDVCGVYVPRDAHRPYRLHVCPGHRVVPRMPGSPARFDELVDQFKTARLAGEDLTENEGEQLGALFGLYPARHSKAALKAWSERLDNLKAIERLAEAGAIVIAKYDSVIPGDFINAVRSQFCDQTLNSPGRCTCFVWHRSEASWSHRFSMLGTTKPQGEVTGMTPFWDKHETRAKPARLAANYPPLNRSIEFPKPKLDMLVHEMIHWCTSPAYDAYTHDNTSGDDRTLVREGTTEWLKCHAVGVFGGGGYKDVLPIMQMLLKDGVVTERQMMEAYFGGVNVKETVDKMVAGYHAHLRGRFDVTAQKSLAQERTLLSTQINGNSLYLVAKRSPDYRERVFKAFKDASVHEREAALSGPRWRRYLQARIDGKTDAQAVESTAPVAK